MPRQSTCPCGSGQDYATCCEPRINGNAPAATAEQLMRSRYTAYVVKDSDYLLRTWHPRSRPARLDLQDPPLQWRGLKIVSTRAGQPGDTEGEVEFIARYKLNGKAHRLHEKSCFVWEQGQWFYRHAELQN